MAKIEKKSITDIIGLRPQSRKPTADEIDKITRDIHEASVATTPPVPVIVAPSPAVVSEEKIKRISVNVPVLLYLKAKTKATMQDQTLMAYITKLMEKDLG